VTGVLILLTLPEDVRRQYRDRLSAAFPELTVEVADHHSKVEPAIARTEVLLTFGPMMADHVVRDAPRLNGAVLDVFDEEPLPQDHPLWEFDNVVITPHISGPSAPVEIAPIFNDNLRRYLTRRPLRYVVDRERGY
jgi:D-isomer specific 2-hydroxyacid dehydrogenase, NAD binding domain